MQEKGGGGTYCAEGENCECLHFPLIFSNLFILGQGQVHPTSRIHARWDDSPSQGMMHSHSHLGAIKQTWAEHTKFQEQ